MGSYQVLMLNISCALVLCNPIMAGCVACRSKALRRTAGDACAGCSPPAGCCRCRWDLCWRNLHRPRALACPH
jgi:hypothetical protein